MFQFFSYSNFPLPVTLCVCVCVNTVAQMINPPQGLNTKLLY
jgi:hypothetical protein